MERYFAMKSKNDELRQTSSSGGVFFALGCRILAQGGIVYGACYDEQWNVVHRRAQTQEELKQFSGSKYVRSDWSACLPQIQTDLQSGIPVLFSGTPCQTAAVQKLSQYGDLTVVDIICHGAAEPAYFAAYRTMMEQKFGAPIVRLNMRYKPPKRYQKQKQNPKAKRCRLDPHTMQIQFANGKEYICDSDYDPYYLLMDSLFRDACYRCPYANLNRPSDLTLGDFHEFSTSLGKFNDQNGVSLAITHTEKGQALLASVMDGYDYKEKTKQEILQPALLNPPKKPKTIPPEAFRAEAEKIIRNPRLKIRKLCDKLGILNIYLSIKNR